jgi:GntR family transcriptional regulator, rspAB operon transcriptional repressor
MLQADLPKPQAQTPAHLRLRPLDDFPGSLALRAYASLKHAILHLTYRPGEPLRKPDICEHWGISRSPVSEAVARLAADGLVDVIPQAGTFVARFSLAEIREGAFLREALEIAAVERIAPTITDDQLTLLRRNLRLQSLLIEDQDFDGFYQADAALHELIQSFTGFRRLTQLSQTASVHLHRARRLILPQPGRAEMTLAEHHAIVSALEARDPQAARLAMRRHLGQMLSLLEPLIAQMPEFFE